MKKLKLLSFIVPATTIACVTGAVACAPQSKTEGWTDFELINDDKPYFQSQTTIDMVKDKSYTASFKIEDPQSKLPQETGKILIAIGSNVAGRYDFTANPTFKLLIGGIEQDAQSEMTEGKYCITSQWDHAFTGNELKFTFTCAEDFAKACITIQIAED